MRTPQLPKLPILPVLPEIRRELEQRSQLILAAPPGAGKSTCVPLALLDAGWLAGRRVLMLEPRRLAARAVAVRMAELLGETPGQTVGYRMRLERRTSSRTRIEVITEGLLAADLQRDPALEHVGCLLFDEFHERSLQADLGLALALDSQRHLRPDLRLVVMSATLDEAALAALLPGAARVRAEGLSYPVDTLYLPRSAGQGLLRLAAAAVRRALEEFQGDILVFLPGAGEIRQLAARLDQDLAGQRLAILPLYGELAREQQAAALRPDAEGRRRIVLATNIAETSLTIDGIGIVIDSGLERRPRFDPRSGMSRLVTTRIAQSSAEQRRGRAGRLGPGVCLRLWTGTEQRQLSSQARAEILEADLAPLALELAGWGSEAGELSWLDPPPPGALAQAKALLLRLGALDEDGRITGHGRAMARLGTHPRLAHLLLLARERGLAMTGATLAALLGERDPLARSEPAVDTDLRSRLALFAPGGTSNADRGAIAAIRRTRGLLLRQLGAEEAPVEVDAAGRLLALAYPDRIAQRRSTGGGRYRLSNGRGAWLPPHDPLCSAGFLAVADLEDGDSEARIRLAAPLSLADLEQLFGTRIQARDEISWDPHVQGVIARRQRWLDALLIADEPLPSPDREQVRHALLQGLAGLGPDSLPWTREARTLRARIALARRLQPDRGWPDLGDEALMGTLSEWLGPWLDGVSRTAQLARLDLTGVLRARLDFGLARELDRLLPTHVPVPSGSRIAIDYLAGPDPVLAVKLQELFGLAETPRVADGQLPLTLHLLSPARRPVQITRDLASFWANGYPDVRKELKGRYPKHAWPEDPCTASPARR
ncbi:MAG: ATP-dependent helicase HrpB [Chromatiales bacterium]|nr:ATP-dependent helicase HrpB [Chromatiales bacterium]